MQKKEWLVEWKKFTLVKTKCLMMSTQWMMLWCEALTELESRLHFSTTPHVLLKPSWSIWNLEDSSMKEKGKLKLKDRDSLGDKLCETINKMINNLLNCKHHYKSMTKRRRNLLIWVLRKMLTTEGSF